MGANLTLDEYALLTITLAVFAVIGFRRGINRELLAMVGIGVAMLVAGGVASFLGPLINLGYKIARFGLSGGLTAGDPTTAWQAITRQPNLLPESAQDRVLLSLAFGCVVLVFYLVGERRISGTSALIPQILGLVAGGINGFLIAYHLFPLLLPQPTTVIMLPSQDLNAALGSGRTLAWVIVFFVTVLIAFGLYSASGPRRK